MHQHEALELFREAECLVDQQTVKAAIDRMASCIHADLANRLPVVLSVMHGGMIVGGELLTRLHFPLEVGYVHASRYGFSTVGSELEWLSPAPAMVQGRTVLLVDDILDEGVTLLSIKQACLQLGATQVLTAVLLEKDHDRKACPGYHADYTGLVIPDRFVFGYGLDIEGLWRNAPGIYALKGM